MSTIIFKKNYCFFSFLLYLFTFSGVLCSTTPGKIIVLYGTHCGGKSTLAEELVKQLPEKYEIIKKRYVISEIKKDYIEKLTGKRPKKRKEINKIAHSLPPSSRKKVLGFHSKATQKNPS